MRINTLSPTLATADLTSALYTGSGGLATSLSSGIIEYCESKGLVNALN